MPENPPNFIQILWIMGLIVLLSRQVRIWWRSRQQNAWHAFNAAMNLIAIYALWNVWPQAMLLVLFAVATELARTKLAVRFYRSRANQDKDRK
ncbi:hypothetical protein RQP54_18120 [Curvibacter sp. APW13]|uniref:hypothetical protein n=1 Tax=Curvibacter sp. APW13 TaxID=3077236 RepID=UPI0028DE1E68|nr:hypothetical protein [Curvibacter sp. APW13]MDT8992795.1 hypothetical protein [Curvibacter sp. APW13]